MRLTVNNSPFAGASVNNDTAMDFAADLKRWRRFVE